MTRIMTFREFCDADPSCDDSDVEGLRVFELMQERQDAYADYLEESARIQEQWLSESQSEDSSEFELELLFELQSTRDSPG